MHSLCVCLSVCLSVSGVYCHLVGQWIYIINFLNSDWTENLKKQYYQTYFMNTS